VFLQKPAYFETLEVAQTFADEMNARKRAKRFPLSLRDFGTYTGEGVEGSHLNIQHSFRIMLDVDVEM